MAIITAVMAPLVLVALAIVAIRSPLLTFNTLVPWDRGARLAREGAAYGADPRQALDVYVPAGGGHDRPMIVFFYGGGWNSGTRSGYGFIGHALAAAGFVTIIPDYRLVPEVRYPAFLEDSTAAVRWARAHAGEWGGDPDRIVLAGHSAGAYNAAMLAIDPRWLGGDRAAIRGLIGLAGPYDFLPFDDPVAIEAFGRWPHPAETQPITHVAPGAPPALLATGADDERVRPGNSEALAARLKAAGVPVTLRRYARTGHGMIVMAIARPLRSRAPVLRDMIAFARETTRARLD